MASRQSLQLVLFDLDDTLFDHQHSRRCALLALQKVYPRLAQVSIADLVAEHERQLRASYDAVLDGAVSLEANRLERFRRLFINYGSAMTPLEVEQAQRTFRRAYVAHRQAVPGVIPLLTYLKSRVKIGVVTNGLKAVQWEKLRACNLEDSVNFLLTSEEAGMKKPDRRIFVRALDIADAQPQVAVYIGDSWTSDVLGASSAGIRTIWLNRSSEPCPDPALTTELSAFEPLERAVQALHIEHGNALSR